MRTMIYVLLTMTLTPWIAFGNNSNRETPFSPFFGTYSITSCSGQFGQTACAHKFLRISSSRSLNQGKPVPTAAFRFADNLQTGAFSEAQFSNQFESSYEGSLQSGQFKEPGQPDARTGSRINQDIQFTKISETEATLTLIKEEISKEGQILRSEMNLKLQRQ